MPVLGMERKNGTVGAIRDQQYVTNGEAALWRNVFIRTGSGEIEVIQYAMEADLTKVTDSDTVVFKNGNVAGITSLSEGDTVEYIVNADTALYVHVVKPVEITEVTGMLRKIEEAERIITLADRTGKEFQYTVS
jgi:hypothetical protein